MGRGQLGLGLGGSLDCTHNVRFFLSKRCPKGVQKVSRSKNVQKVSKSVQKVSRALCGAACTPCSMGKTKGGCKCPMHHLTRAAVCGDWEKVGDLFKCVKCGVAIPYDKNDWRKSEPGRSARIAQQHADPRVPCPDVREDRVPSPILWLGWLTVLVRCRTCGCRQISLRRPWNMSLR